MIHDMDAHTNILNNFDLFEKYILDFSTDNIGDPFIYQIDLIERKKDGVKTSGANNSARRITSFYPESLEQWEKYKHRIIDLCDSRRGLRAYVNPSRKRASTILLQMNADIAERLKHKAYTGQNKIYASSIASCKPSRSDSLWILDIDSDDPFTAEDIMAYFADFEESPIVACLPSKSGSHIITKPFNKPVFETWLNNTYNGKADKESIVKINALTNLYANFQD